MTIKARACATTGAMLRATLCVVQNRDDLNLHADPGVAARKMPPPSGSPVGILLFHEKNPSGTYAVARCTEMLPLLICTIPQGGRTTAC
ncbi:hypothetical protein RQ744_15895 [Roseomonas mucosa]|uniref:hypothetical protein n=1 Tax=Roseomonas mucosa TaxID=207340 RepID=UPI001EF6A615|nr:hypothetical protein [Roseomonas mucosa]MCG7352172.1 hypothetical protein [Roseomonas mucosa]MCG7357477.1 hypothetical protein [Roseomonas mucosa]MDT8295461.1 hypothetical protein [Roseomonas mucosa]